MWEGAITQSADVARSPDLSIVIPAYNEARRLPLTLKRLYEYLRDQTFTWEIIVVSNGSTDKTDNEVRSASAWLPNIELVSIPERGKGRATREGVLRSRGEVVFLCDADLSMPPDSLTDFLSAAEDVDVVVGSREAPGARRIGEPWHRHLMGRVFNRLVQMLAVRGIHDTQCGFKAIRRAPAENLFSRQTLTGWGFDVEILYLAKKYGYRMKELPIQWYFDSDTRVRPGIDTISMLRELLMIRLRDMQGHYSGPQASPVSEGDRVGR